MSWLDIITNNLINFQSRFGHIYNNVLTDAIIIDFKGNICGNTGIPLYNDEDEKIKDIFNQKYNKNLYLKLRNKIYRIIHYEQNYLAYLRDYNAGATVVKTNQLFIIGFYDIYKNFFYDGQIRPQCAGTCNHVVEELAIKLKKLNF